jgi:hypothetical protein
MAQQTAMQALVELMKINDIYKPCMPYLLEIIDEVYLPMEKKQIMEAYVLGDNGYIPDDGTQERMAEQYYNKTYNK